MPIITKTTINTVKINLAAKTAKTPSIANSTSVIITNSKMERKTIIQSYKQLNNTHKNY